MLKTYLLAFTFALAALSTIAHAADSSSEHGLTGYVVKLAEKTNASEPQSINVGGLVIAVIRDSGSRPPQDVSVVASKSLEKLGVVRGVENDEGVALMGGGYNWHLFKPTKAGNATVKVSYTENGDGGKRVQREYKLTVGSE
jgi:hypothetical protein